MLSLSTLSQFIFWTFVTPICLSPLSCLQMFNMHCGCITEYNFIMFCPKMTCYKFCMFFFPDLSCIHVCFFKFSVAILEIFLFIPPPQNQRPYFFPLFRGILTKFKGCQKCEENKEMTWSAENFATLKLGTAKNGWKRNKIDEKVDKLGDMHGNFGTKRLISSLFVKISQISLSPGVGVGGGKVVRKFTIEQLT